MGTTLQARIASTDDVNKDSYLTAIADRIVTYPGSPNDWGKRQDVPQDFGLAASASNGANELDIDKISRLSSQNRYALGYVELVNAAQLNDMALGITVSQVMTLTIEQSSSHTVGSETYSTVHVWSSINSKPTGANLHCYLIADNYVDNLTAVIPESGTYTLTVHLPSALVDDALLVVFARAPFDDRITSYATYNLSSGIQQTTPNGTTLSMSPQDYTLSFNQSSVTIGNVYALTYSYMQNVTSIQTSTCAIPRLIDNSPFVLVACAGNGANYVEEWTAYPQVPLNAGSSFEGSERNVFSYLVTVDGVLYRLEVSLGDVNH